MFNKRENQDSDVAETATIPSPASPAQGRARESARGSTQPAVIGPSVSIDGELKGEEDLIVEGRIKGVVSLRQHTLTIGEQGRLDAEIYANTILVDGTVKGDLFAAERISIRQSARIDGNIVAPRISLEDGAKFRGTIDMNPESEGFRKAFGKSATTGAGPEAVKPAGGDSEKSPDAAKSGGDSAKAPDKKPVPARSGSAA